MARRPLTTAFGRVISATLTAEGFHEDGLRWWLRSDLGDFAVVDVQASRELPATEICYVNVASVPGPFYDWLRWLNPASDTGEGPSTSHGMLHDRVQPPGNPWLLFSNKESAAELGAWVSAELAGTVVPRLRRRFDREALLAELAEEPATGHAVLVRAAFRAEAGDVSGADEVLGPTDDDDENLARYRTWLHEYAATRTRR